MTTTTSTGTNSIQARIDLRNLHILVTGASRGIGKAIAELLHREGARVSLMARNGEDLTAMVAKAGDGMAAQAVDLTDLAGLEGALKPLREAHGPVDMIINNAGIGFYKPFDEYSTEENRTMVDLNVTAIAELTRQVLPDLKASKVGTVVNVASDIGRRPMPNMALYSATKHAVAGLTTSLSMELQPFDVRVLLLNPGLTDSYFGGRSLGDLAPPFALTPEDVADIAHFMITRPHHVSIGEVTVNPMQQKK